MNKAALKRSAYAWTLLAGYGLLLWVSAFHTHECWHEHDRTETETTGAVHVNIPAHLAFLAKACLFHSSGVPELSVEHQCCVESGLRDCDQTQFLPRSRLALQEGCSEELLPALLPFSKPESDFGIGFFLGNPRVCTFLPFLTSIRSVRLLI